MAETNYWSRFWQTKMSRRRVLQGAALGSVGLAAAAVIGCGDDEESPSTSGTPAASAAAEQPVRGGTFIYINGSEALPHLDPQRNSFGVLHENGPAMIYSRLMNFDLEKYPENIAFTGDLAASYENPDPTTFTFKLRPNVKWQNIAPVSGRSLTAQDVIYTFERINAEKTNAGIVSSIDKVEAPDSSTVKMTLKAADADFMFAAADARIRIVAKEAVDVNGNLENGPNIGSGPWIFDSWTPEQVLNLKRNPDYYMQGQPYVDAYQRVIIADQNTAQSAFRTGQGHIVNTNGQITRLLKQSVPNLQVVDQKLWAAGSFLSLLMNPERGLNKDVRVRKALNLALNREAIIQDVYFGSAWLNAGVFVQSVDWLLPDSELNRYLGRDLAQAKQLLSAAGVDVSTYKPVIDVGNVSQDQISAGEVYVANLKEVGITGPTVNLIDKTEITNRAYIRGESEVYLGSHRTSGGGTNGHLRLFYHTKGTDSAPFQQLGDTQLDQMIDRQATMLNEPEARKALIQDIQRRILDLCAGMPSYTQNSESALQPSVKGYKQLSTESQRFTRLWLSA